MATPYFQVRLDTAGSTQDVARRRIEELPLLVIASSQTAGRGRDGKEWLNADRALAASMALRLPDDDQRPFSLMAGVAAVRAVEGASLKWPNDVMIGDLKVGGILVERSEDLVVIGLGLNLWWPQPPEGASALYAEDPGEERHAEIGALWGAELMRVLDEDGWPIDEYREHCDTLGRTIAWEPDGLGKAIEVGRDGGLIVDFEGELHTVYSGSIRYVG